MRRFSSMPTFLVTVFILLLVANPAAAAQRDGWVGDVAVVAWLETDLLKVALANGGSTRVNITLSSEGWDQGWRPFFLDRTIVVPARTVVIEGFNLSSDWRGEPLTVRASAWDREALVEVQTSQIFRPSSYVASSQEEIEVFVDLAFMAAEREAMYLMVDDYYKGIAQSEIGEITVRSVEGGFHYSPARRRVEKIDPYMVLSLWAPRPERSVTTISFNMYKVKDDNYRNYYDNEIEGPTILVYDRNLAYQDNSHLNLPPTPPWNWRR